MENKNESDNKGKYLVDAFLARAKFLIAEPRNKGKHFMDYLIANAKYNASNWESLEEPGDLYFKVFDEIEPEQDFLNLA